MQMFDGLFGDMIFGNSIRAGKGAHDCDRPSSIIHMRVDQNSQWDDDGGHVGRDD